MNVDDYEKEKKILVRRASNKKTGINNAKKTFILWTLVKTKRKISKMWCIEQLDLHLYIYSEIPLISDLYKEFLAFVYWKMHPSGIDENCSK